MTTRHMTRTIKYLFLGLTLIGFQPISFAQQRTIDSLELVLTKAKSDTSKLSILTHLYSTSISNSDYDKTLAYAKNGFSLSTKTGNKKAIAEWLYNIAYTNHYFSKYPIALDYYIRALNVNEEIGDKKASAKCLAGIGIINSVMGEKAKALEKYNEALSLYTQIRDTSGIVAMENNIAGYYYMNGEKEKAIERFKSVLTIIDESKKYVGYRATILSNMAGIYCELGKHEMAFKTYQEASIFIDQSSYSLSMLYTDWGSCYFDQKNLDQTLNYILKRHDIAQEFNLYDRMMSSASLLSDIYEKKGDLKNTLKYYKILMMANDSLLNRDKNKQIAELNTKYETEKKQKEIELLNKEKEKQATITAEQNKRKNIIIVSSLIGLLLVIVFAGFMFNRWRITQTQKKVIEASKQIIEEKNKDITDSINYAKRIQQAKLPDRKEIYSVFPDSFVLFKPKDIVSGDFYYFHNDKSIFIASADCTGHGVPGAFMSMICSEKLDDAVGQSADTSEILKILNKGIKSSLKQSDSTESTRDGMDIALCSVDTINRIVKYAGANRPLWIIRNGQTVVEEIKATKKAIGGLTEDNQHFDSHEIKLQRGDTFYISTDSYADTFSGVDSKKLTTKKFKEILISIQSKSMQDQEVYLDSFIEDWKAHTEQVDDILVIGVRL